MNTPGTTLIPVSSNPSSQATIRPIGFWRRLGRGIGCWLTFAITPLGWFCYGRLIRRLEPERLDKGLVLILTGIEGRSFLNVGLLAGMIDGGIGSAVEICDWTTGNKFLILYHLRGWKRNLRTAKEVAARIVEYQDRFPGRPVWLVGHSGGGAMALLTAASLPEDRKLTGLVMIAAAVSPTFDVRPALDKVETAIWNYYSWFDWFFLIFGTTVLGTIDGRHCPAAGSMGLRNPHIKELEATGRLIQVRWNWRMLGQFNLGEHFGCVHRVFIAEEIAPLILRSEAASQK